MRHVSHVTVLFENFAFYILNINQWKPVENYDADEHQHKAKIRNIANIFSCNF